MHFSYYSLYLLDYNFIKRIMSQNTNLAAISLDLDNQWSYMKIHGDAGWEKYPSYFDIFIPHVLDILDDLELKITFFIVGRDADIEENKKYLRMITERGHEVGNHSYNHESWLQTYTFEEIEKEIVTAEAAIERTTSQKPRGFRGPGFSWSIDLLRVLEKRGYSYDASTLPTYLGPLARKYYFMKSDLSKDEKKARKELFGKFSDGFRQLKPYYHDLGKGKRLAELPVTTIPFIKVPFHLSYLLYISNISITLMKIYLRTGIMLCKITRTPVSFLLHPLDIIGGDKLNQLAFFPGMNISTERKVRIFKTVLKTLKNDFKLVSMTELITKN
jgi:peptidoglycan-N-acetylglucosamine deacetylase